MKAWKIIRTLLAIAGATIIFCAVGASDFYVIELGQTEPDYVWNLMIVGALMMLPKIFSL